MEDIWGVVRDTNRIDTNLGIKRKHYEVEGELTASVAVEKSPLS